MDTLCTVCHQAEAKYACSCAFPAVLVCSGCLEDHLHASGTHIPAPVQKQAALMAPTQVQANEVCDGCHEKSAVRFCLCAVPVPKFCEDCDFAHYRKAPLLNHSEHLISAYAAVASGRVPLKDFKKKQQFINDFQHRLTQELVTIDTFVNQVAEKFDQLIALVTTKKEALLRDLQVQRAKLAGYINAIQLEIDAKRYADELDAKTELDEILLRGYHFPIPEIQLFDGSLDLQQIPALLEQSVKYNVVSYLRLQPIPVIKGDSLRLYDSHALLSQTTLNQPTQIDGKTAYCYLTAFTLLCCGGQEHNEVYKVNVRESSAVRVANMNEARYTHGILKYKNECVYVFGGQANGNDLKTAEKYQLTTTPEIWTNVRGTLKAGRHCSACEHADSIYISEVDGGSSSFIEHFNTKNETFTELRTNQRFISILCSDGRDLYCISAGTVEQVNFAGPAAATFAVRTTFKQIGDGHYWLCCPMKWQMGELVSVFNYHYAPVGIFRFNPAKEPQFAQVIALTY